MPKTFKFTALITIYLMFSFANAQSLFDLVDMDSPNMTEAQMTRDELISLLEESTTGIDLTDKKLSGLDLSGIDFKQADLSWSRLNKSNLSNANLTGTKLDLAWLIDTNLENADLTNAHMFSTQLTGANLNRATFVSARIVANFTSAKLENTDFSNADLSADMKNQSMGLMRTVFISANLSNSNFNNANLSHIDAEFANFRNSILDQAKLTNAKLAGVDFTGASVKEINLAEADLNASIWKNLSGEDTIIGLNEAVNFDKVIRN